MMNHAKCEFNEIIANWWNHCFSLALQSLLLHLQIMFDLPRAWHGENPYENISIINMYNLRKGTSTPVCQRAWYASARCQHWQCKCRCFHWERPPFVIYQQALLICGVWQGCVWLGVCVWAVGWCVCVWPVHFHCLHTLHISISI